MKQDIKVNLQLPYMANHKTHFKTINL